MGVKTPALSPPVTETTGPVVPQRQGGPPPRPGRTLVTAVCQHIEVSAAHLAPTRSAPCPQKPPQHPKELCFDPNTRERESFISVLISPVNSSTPFSPTAPEIDRNDKPGRKKTDPPPVPSAHPPLPAADTEEGTRTSVNQLLRRFLTTTSAFRFLFRNVFTVSHFPSWDTVV